MSVPILGCRITSKQSIQFVHGSHNHPVFETLQYPDMDKFTCLVRKVETAPPTADVGMKFMVTRISSNN
jgi:hypothetical protein